MPSTTRVHSAPRMSRTLSLDSTSSTASSSSSPSSEDSDLYAGDRAQEASIRYPEPRQTQSFPLNRMPLFNYGTSAEVPDRADFSQSGRALLHPHRGTRERRHSGQVFGALEPVIADVIGNQSQFYRFIAQGVEQCERQNTFYALSDHGLGTHLDGMDLAMSKTLEQDPQAVAGFRHCSSITKYVFNRYFTQHDDIKILHDWCKDLEKMLRKKESKNEKMRKKMRKAEREEDKKADQEVWGLLGNLLALALKIR